MQSTSYPVTLTTLFMGGPPPISQMREQTQKATGPEGLSQFEAELGADFQLPHPALVRLLLSCRPSPLAKEPVEVVPKKLGHLRHWI